MDENALARLSSFIFPTLSAHAANWYGRWLFGLINSDHEFDNLLCFAAPVKQ